MRIVETTELAADRVENPGLHDLLDEAAILARRYLTALGYTAYRAIRELGRSKHWVSITYGLASGGVPSGVWILRPIGSQIEEADWVVAKRYANKIGAQTWAVANGIRLEGEHGGQKFDIDLRTIVRVEGSFEQLIRLAADPSDFLTREEKDE